MDPNPMERLVEYIMSLSTNIELPVEIVKLFLKLRFFLTLNTDLAKHFTRNMKQKGQFIVK